MPEDWDDYWGGRETWAGVEDNRPLWPWIVGALVVLAGIVAAVAYAVL